MQLRADRLEEVPQDPKALYDSITSETSIDLGDNQTVCRNGSSRYPMRLRGRSNEFT